MKIIRKSNVSFISISLKTLTNLSLFGGKKLKPEADQSLVSLL